MQAPIRLTPGQPCVHILQPETHKDPPASRHTCKPPSRLALVAPACTSSSPLLGSRSSRPKKIKKAAESHGPAKTTLPNSQTQRPNTQTCSQTKRPNSQTQRPNQKTKLPNQKTKTKDHYLGKVRES